MWLQSCFWSTTDHMYHGGPIRSQWSRRIPNAWWHSGCRDVIEHAPLTYSWCRRCKQTSVPPVVWRCGTRDCSNRLYPPDLCKDTVVFAIQIFSHYILWSLVKWSVKVRKYLITKALNSITNEEGTYRSSPWLRELHRLVQTSQTCMHRHTHTVVLAVINTLWFSLCQDSTAWTRTLTFWMCIMSTLKQNGWSSPNQAFEIHPRWQLLWIICQENSKSSRIKKDCFWHVCSCNPPGVPWPKWHLPALSARTGEEDTVNHWS